MIARGTVCLALAALPCLAGAAGSGMARAEERDPFALKPPLPLLRGDVAGTRQIPGHAPQGMRIGALLVHPQVTLRADADSNILNRANDRAGDVALRLAPAVRAEGESGPLRFALGAQGTVARHHKLSGQDHETFGIDAKAGLPLGGALTLGASGAYARKLEPNHTVGAAQIDTGPTLFDQLSGTLAARAEFGVTRLEAKLEHDRYNYLPVQMDGGARADQSFRDIRVLAGTVRAERAVAGGRIVFLQGALRAADSLHPAPCCSRSSRGGEVLAGIRGDLSGLLAAEISAGYRWRGYRSPRFADYRGALWRARVEWYATPLISVSVSARRDIVDAGLPGAAGAVVDSVGLKVFHEFRRHVGLVLSAGHSREKYRDDAAFRPTARTVSVAAEPRYALSSRWLAGAYARYRNRSSDSALLPRLGQATEGGLWLRFQI